MHGTHISSIYVIEEVLIKAPLQELSELQDAEESDKAVVACSIAAGLVNSFKAILCQGPLHGEDRDLR